MPPQTSQSFKDLYTSVQTFGYGASDLGNIKTWINMAYRDVANRRRWSWLEFHESVSFVVGRRFYSLPSLDYWGTTTATGTVGVIPTPNVDGLQVGDSMTVTSADGLTVRGTAAITVITPATPSFTVAATPYTNVATTDLVYRVGIGVDSPVYFGRLRPAQDGPPEPRFIDKRKLTPDYHRAFLATSSTGTPQAYTIWDSTLEVFPWPDATYAYELYGWMGVQTLVNDTDVTLIPAQFRDVLVYGALVHAADQDRDQGLKDDRSHVYEAMIAQMYAADEFTNQETVLKADMPRHYYGAFDDRTMPGRVM